MIDEKLLNKLQAQTNSKITDIKIFDKKNIVGNVELDHRRQIPFQNDKLITEIGGYTNFNFSSYTHLQPNGKLAGAIETSDGRHALFQGNNLIFKIDGYEILDYHYIHTNLNGELAGAIKIFDGTNFRTVPFQGNNLIFKIDGYEIFDYWYLYVKTKSQKLTGIIKTNYGTIYYVHNDDIIGTIVEIEDEKYIKLD